MLAVRMGFHMQRKVKSSHVNYNVKLRAAETTLRRKNKWECFVLSLLRTMVLFL